MVTSDLEVIISREGRAGADGQTDGRTDGQTDLLADGGVVGAVRGAAQGRGAVARQPPQLAVARAVPQVHAGVGELGGRGLHLGPTNDNPASDA